MMNRSMSRGPVARSILAFAVTAALAVLPACSSRDQADASHPPAESTATPGLDTMVQTAPTTPSPDTAAQAPPAPGTDSWTVGESNTGPVRYGMTVAELRSALGGDIKSRDTSSPCYYVTTGRAPDGLNIMVVDGRVARVDVHGNSIVTAAGAHVGDTEARIKELYPNVKVQPHKYVEKGHYMVVTGADPKHQIIFETDGTRVTIFRAGVLPAIEWVEGCS